jgi:hypothetical protein
VTAARADSSSFLDCMIENMKGQPASMQAIVTASCRKRYPIDRYVTDKRVRSKVCCGAISMKPKFFVAAVLSVLSFSVSADRYMGNLTSNPFLPKAPSQPSGAFTNPYGNSSNSPKLYDSQGTFRGNLNSNSYDADSVANPYGRYGSQYSPDSINNPYGAGSPYGSESPSNPYSNGLRIYGN